MSRWYLINSKQIIYIILIYSKGIFFINIMVSLKRKSSAIITIILGDLKRRLDKPLNFKNSSIIST